MENMRTLFLVVVLISSTMFLLSPQPVSAWGYSVHREVVSRAIDLLPSPWNDYFDSYREDLQDASIYPDQRKGSDPAEGGRHYDDQDTPHWDRNVPFPSTNWSLGVVSWAIENSTRDLIISLERENEADIILYMGDIAHYVADATQPLHATTNYDGQLTGNHGIHSRFETSLVSRNFDDAFGIVEFPDLSFIDDPYVMAEDQIATGLALVPSVLEADDKARDETGSYNDRYYEILYEETRPIVRERLALAILNTANLWYTALLTAGWIELTSSTTSPITTTNSTEITSISTNPTISQITPSPMSLWFLLPIPIFIFRSIIFSKKN